MQFDCHHCDRPWPDDLSQQKHVSVVLDAPLMVSTSACSYCQWDTAKMWDLINEMNSQQWVRHHLACHPCFSGLTNASFPIVSVQRHSALMWWYRRRCAASDGIQEVKQRAMGIRVGQWSASIAYSLTLISIFSKQAAHWSWKKRAHGHKSGSCHLCRIAVATPAIQLATCEHPPSSIG